MSQVAIHSTNCTSLIQQLISIVAINLLKFQTSLLSSRRTMNFKVASKLLEDSLYCCKDIVHMWNRSNTKILITHQNTNRSFKKTFPLVKYAMVTRKKYFQYFWFLRYILDTESRYLRAMRLISGFYVNLPNFGQHLSFSTFSIQINKWYDLRCLANRDTRITTEHHTFAIDKVCYNVLH